MFHVKHWIMNQKSETGKTGEDLACEYLKDKGYKILLRNYRQKWGEIDIIAKDPKGVLVFVEVKTMRQWFDKAHHELPNKIAELKPEDNMTASKLRKVKRTASLFAGSNEDLVGETGWRVDLVAITMFHDKHCEINHYENV